MWSDHDEEFRCIGTIGEVCAGWCKLGAQLGGAGRRFELLLPWPMKLWEALSISRRPLLLRGLLRVTAKPLLLRGVPGNMFAPALVPLDTCNA